MTMTMLGIEGGQAENKFLTCLISGVLDIVKCNTHSTLTVTPK
jgi:hypothetical protein